MLCINSADGRAANFIEDVNGLATVDCLNFLLRYAGQNLAGYYLTYDWTMVLRDLPNEAIWTLLRPETRILPDEGRSFRAVKWQGYELHYLAGMMRIRRGNRSVTIWDVGKYYQSTFVSALESSGFAPPELIERLKGERGTDSWTDDRLDDMRAYCLEECMFLARLTELLEKQHYAIDLKPRAWHGPGSTASALLDKHGIRNYLVSPPAEVQHCAQCAYFGGRFEHSIAGSRKDMWAYDVRSAYPAAATSLPCLAHSRWVHQRRAPADNDIALIRYRITDIGDRVWGPLPCRLGDGSIVWSRGGQAGWCWSVEFNPAQAYWRGVEYGGECWVLQRNCSCTPFDFLHELYEWRVSRPENKQIVKLAMNSVYGKLAQTIGGGKFASRAWAGIITATCRARMLELIARHADESHLAAIATDGAYSSEHFDIDEPRLGAWEVGHKGEMVFLRPGIYWATKDIEEWYGAPEDKKKKDKALKAVKARGVGRKKMLEQLEHARQAVEAGEQRVLLGTSTQFGNARECVYKTPKNVIKRAKAYGEWLEAPVSLSLKAAPKRALDWRPPLLSGVESIPYNKAPEAPDAKMLQLIGSMLEGRL